MSKAVVTDERVEAGAKAYYYACEKINEHDDVDGLTWEVPWEDVRDHYPATYEACIAAAKVVLSAALSHGAEAVEPDPAPESHLSVPCPCTLIEQDEDCSVGYPSLICGICEGKGHTSPDQVTALACEMIKIASDMGEPEDPFAAWESIDLIKSQHAQFRKALDKISGMIDDESAGFDEAIETATYALRLAKAEATTEGSDHA